MKENKTLNNKSEREIVRMEMYKDRERARRSRIQLSLSVIEHKEKVIDGSAT